MKHFRNQFVLEMDSNFIRSPYLIVPEDLLGLQDQNHDLLVNHGLEAKKS